MESDFIYLPMPFEDKLFYLTEIHNHGMPDISAVKHHLHPFLYVINPRLKSSSS